LSFEEFYEKTKRDVDAKIEGEISGREDYKHLKYAVIPSMWRRRIL